MELNPDFPWADGRCDVMASVLVVLVPMVCRGLVADTQTAVQVRSQTLQNPDEISGLNVGLIGAAGQSYQLCLQSRGDGTRLPASGDACAGRVKASDRVDVPGNVGFDAITSLPFGLVERPVGAGNQLADRVR